MSMGSGQHQKLDRIFGKLLCFSRVQHLVYWQHSQTVESNNSRQQYKLNSQQSQITRRRQEESSADVAGGNLTF